MRLRSLKAGTGLIIGLGALCACQGTASVGGAVNEGGGGGGGGGGSPPLAKADKVDILLDIDNSRSMADKQQVLALALSDLVQALVNPPCLDANGQPVAQPPSPNDACPVGSAREYAPVEDIHLGIISSSLGGHGSDACGTTGEASNDDKGHLLARTATGPGGMPIPTYQDQGFLAWDPGAKYSPPGESDPIAMANTFKDMVLGVGQVGCGYESQLESWYRFLVDPEPYESLTVDTLGDGVTLNGTDTVLLQQRADFLRPDSMLAIIMLTDENDCSIREEGQYYYVAVQTSGGGAKFHLPVPRSECATNPNDPCCRSCGQAQGNCPADPSCQNPDGSIKSLTDLEDATNLRCYDQKRRFGIDFLYPIDRYTQALTSATIANRSGEMVPNPIFSDLNPNDAYSNIRDPGLVVLTGIVGVPWQDIARDPQNLALGFKSATELTDSSAWDVILGDPANYVPPQDPLMVESIDARSGTNPITGDPISPPGSISNPINGSEWTIASRNDLQYACIFDLPAGTEKDCSVPGTSCDCSGTGDDLTNPLCAPNPNDGGNLTLQVRAKSYPGIRELSVLKGMGAQGVTTSICPAQLDTPTNVDYAYRPVVRSLLERMATRL